MLIGYQYFGKVIRTIRPTYISCVIQVTPAFATEYILSPKSTGFHPVVFISRNTTEQNPVFHYPTWSKIFNSHPVSPKKRKSIFPKRGRKIPENQRFLTRKATVSTCVITTIRTHTFNLVTCI